MVAHTRVKTPTAAAQFLISRVHEAAIKLEGMAETLRNYVINKLERETSQLTNITQKLPHIVTLRYLQEKNHQDHLWQRMTSALKLTIESKKNQLNLIQQRTKSCDIEHILSKGFSLALKDGHVITSTSSLQIGDTIQIRMAKRAIVSEVKSIEE